MSLEISGGSYNHSQNTLRLINEFVKCLPSFMEILVANFIQFSSSIAKFLFLLGKLGTQFFLILLKFSQFLSRLTTSLFEVTHTFAF